MNDIDHRALLIKYINHVGNAEGSDFLWDGHRPPTYGNDLEFTDEEWAELQQLSRVETA